MSEVRLVIRDAQREVQADRHGSFAQSVIAALSAEPETIEELDAAMERFMARPGKGFFSGFRAFVDDRPRDAGLVVVDLPGRLVVWDSNCAAVAPEGEVAYHDGGSPTDVAVRYHLTDEWMITAESGAWRDEADERRRRRLQSPPLDTRKVLYGEALLRFVSEECFDAFRSSGAPIRENWEDPAYLREYDRVREIHVRWMMTPREELGARTPREVLLARRRFIDDDLQDRERQWSIMEQCPRGLNPESGAYRTGGFGTNELVVYYDFVRALLWRCRSDLGEAVGDSSRAPHERERFASGEVARLAEFRERWLDSPYSEAGDRTARSIIHNERARNPEGGSGHEAVIDCDCPLCREQAEMSGPVFWHLDGSHLDDDFAFSLWHETEEEWEAEQAAHEAFSRRFEEQRAEQKRLGVEFSGSGYIAPEFAWRMSFSTRFHAEAPLPIRLFAIGEQLSELIVGLGEPDLKASPDAPLQEAETDLIGRLRAVFRRLGRAAESAGPARPDSKILCILAEFGSLLESVAEAYPTKAFECLELRERLSHFLEAPRDIDAAELFDMDSRPC